MVARLLPETKRWKVLVGVWRRDVTGNNESPPFTKQPVLNSAEHRRRRTVFSTGCSENERAALR
jgi:hypothetical protein